MRTHQNRSWKGPGTEESPPCQLNSPPSRATGPIPCVAPHAHLPAARRRMARAGRSFFPRSGMFATGRLAMVQSLARIMHSSRCHNPGLGIVSPTGGERRGFAAPGGRRPARTGGSAHAEDDGRRCGGAHPGTVLRPSPAGSMDGAVCGGRRRLPPRPRGHEVREMRTPILNVPSAALVPLLLKPKLANPHRILLRVRCRGACLFEALDRAPTGSPREGLGRLGIVAGVPARERRF